MKDFAEKLYKSRGWRGTRDAYAQSVHGVCERCLRKGIMSIGEIVHHKIPITEDNIDNPEITLSWENLELLCRKCHAEVHGSRRRYKLDGFGRVIFK